MIDPNNFGDVAMAVFYPAGIGKDDHEILIQTSAGAAYDNNQNLDQNSDGISRREYLTAASGSLQKYQFTPSVTGIKANIVKFANEELSKWQGKTEANTDMHPLLKEYYTAGRCSSWTTTPVTPWSGAFISYVVKKALPSFIGECEHVRYFDNIKTGSRNCKTYPISEISNIQPGDILCKCRDSLGGSNCKIDYNGQYSSQISHCDIIVNKQGNTLELIGGNLGNTVQKRITNFFNDKICAGDTVSFHWNALCEKLTSEKLGRLSKFTENNMEAVNSS